MDRAMLNINRKSISGVGSGIIMNITTATIIVPKDISLSLIKNPLAGLL
jgi:hypothetical protein